MRLTSAVVLAFTILALSSPGTTLGDAPLTGKRIALDAGHGGAELGAQYPANSGNCDNLCEKDLNLAVVLKLEERLIDAGAQVVLTRRGDDYLPTRRERVQLAADGCESLLVNPGPCHALISVHHNGSTDAAHDGMLVIYTQQKQDFPLAQAVHDSLLDLSHPANGTSTSCTYGSTTYPYNFTDEGYIQGGYGMTKTPMVSILTEAYYTTNDCEAQRHLNTTNDLNADGFDDARVLAEAQALYDGIAAYFTSLGSGSCPPGKAAQGRC